MDGWMGISHMNFIIIIIVVVTTSEEFWNYNSSVRAHYIDFEYFRSFWFLFLESQIITTSGGYTPIPGEGNQTISGLDHCTQ